MASNTEEIEITAARITKKQRQARAKKQRENLTAQSNFSVAATLSFERAVEITKQKVARISKESRYFNRKFTDREFDLSNLNETLYWEHKLDFGSPSDKRISALYPGSKFYADGAHPGEIAAGVLWDIWFVAAVSVCKNIPGLLERICVARDEEVGVYGFIFFKDGEWVSTVVDDKIFVSPSPTGNLTPTFGECKDPKETWFPLIEKAFAKIHGDYESIFNGVVGQGLEDLTGGVCTTLITSEIMNVERFWKEELSNVNQNVLFAAQRDPGTTADGKGLADGFTYCIFKAVEFDGKRLLKMGNPFTRGSEWNGPWSDGSEEWTSETMSLLDHKFGKDGAFWMTYEDLLLYFSSIGKCRLFDSSWFIHSAWINYNVVPKSNGHFTLTLPEPEKVVIMLQQPDTHYFNESAKLTYQLSFRVYKQGAKTYLLRSPWTLSPLDNRNINIEVELEAGTYTIVPQVLRVPATAVAAAPTIDQAAILKKERRITRLDSGRDANDDSDEEGDAELIAKKTSDFELKLGLRVYNRHQGATLQPYEQEFPSGESQTEYDQDPEAETTTGNLKPE
ncbi:hypothetical protein G9A89_001561 [Geosiphon pyriformis]|nr:hypothetical protein G9A89_001561 [Geosiphon pyriformis]